MKHLPLLCALVLVAPALVLSSHHSLCAQPKGMRPPTEAQQKAIEQWAGVVRRCQTAKVMYQVANLLKEVTHKVESQKDKGGNYVFAIALEQMHKGAILKAQGLKKSDSELLRESEKTIKYSLDIIYGRLVM